MKIVRGFCAVAGLLLAFAAADASAQSVYSDAWTGDTPNDDETVTIYGYGDADSGGGSGRIGVSVVIYDPSLNQLAVQGGSSFSGYVSAQTSINVSMSSPTGDYRSEAAGDYDYNHFDCGVSWINATSFIADYYFYSSYTSAGVLWGSYIRCSSGSCQSVVLRRNHVSPTSGDFPPYAEVNMLSITIGPVTGCFALSGFGIGGC